MATIYVKTVLNSFTEDPAKGLKQKNYENYDKIKISFHEKNLLKPSGENDLVICTAPLTDPFKFSASPEYTTFGDIVQKLDAMLPGGGIMSNVRGMSEAGTMSAQRETFFGRVETAKLYKGVSPVSYSFSFVCFEDLNKNGQPKNKNEHGWSVYPFLIFTMMSFPNMNPDTLQHLNSIFQSFDGEGLSALNTFGNMLTGVGSAVGLSFKGALQGTKDFFSAVFGDTEGSLYPSDHFAMKTRNCLDIQVSNICSLKNMVIKSFDATFSKEILSSGLPVYTKYSLTVEPIVQPTTQELLDLGEGTGMDGRFFSKLKNMAGKEKISAVDLDAQMRTSKNALEKMTGGKVVDNPNPPQK